MTRKSPDVKQLGKHVALPQSPEEAELERVANPHADTHYAARFTAPEFTSLCPVTGQPDFAHLVIDYARRASSIASAWSSGRPASSRSTARSSSTRAAASLTRATSSSTATRRRTPRTPAGGRSRWIQPSITTNSPPCSSAPVRPSRRTLLVGGVEAITPGGKLRALTARRGREVRVLQRVAELIEPYAEVRPVQIVSDVHRAMRSGRTSASSATW